MIPPLTKWINDIKVKLGFSRTMTAAGADVVDAVNKHSDQIEELDGYLQVKTLSCSSLDNLKSELLSVVSNLAQYRSAYITFYVSDVTTGFITGENYAGTLYVDYKNGSDLVFSTVVSGKHGEVISIGYDFGTWTINNLKDNVIFRDYNFQNITSTTPGEMIQTTINIAISGYTPVAVTVSSTWDEEQWIHTCKLNNTTAVLKSYHLGSTGSTISGFIKVVYIKV